jgi:hypothetical protein
MWLSYCVAGSPSSERPGHCDLQVKGITTNNYVPNDAVSHPRRVEFSATQLCCQPCCSLYLITSQPKYLSIWEVPVLNTCPGVSYPNTRILCLFSSLHANANISQTRPWPFPFVSFQIPCWMIIESPDASLSDPLIQSLTESRDLNNLSLRNKQIVSNNQLLVQLLFKRAL